MQESLYEPMEKLALPILDLAALELCHTLYSLRQEIFQYQASPATMLFLPEICKQWSCHQTSSHLKAHRL
jgi:hypothetical protein